MGAQNVSQKFELRLLQDLQKANKTKNYYALLLLLTPEKLDLIAQILETARESDCLKFAELLQKLDEIK